MSRRGKNSSRRISNDVNRTFNYNEDLQQELRRKLKNYNSKLAREKKKEMAKGEDASYRRLAQLDIAKKSIKDLEAEIITKHDYNKIVRELDYVSKSKIGATYYLDKKTEKSLLALERDFNKKIEREAKKIDGRQKASLPEKISARDLALDSWDRETLQSGIKVYREFLSKGAEKLVKVPRDNSNYTTYVTEWELKAAERFAEEANKTISKERAIRDATEVKYGGKEAGYTRGQVGMNKGDHDIPDAQAYTDSTNSRGIHLRLKQNYRKRSDKFYDVVAWNDRRRYIKMIDDYIGDTAEGTVLKETLNKVPLNDFKRALISEADIWHDLYELRDVVESGDISIYESDAFRRALEKIVSPWMEFTKFEEMVDDYIERKADGLL